MSDFITGNGQKLWKCKKDFIRVQKDHIYIGIGSGCVHQILRDTYNTYNLYQFPTIILQNFINRLEINTHIHMHKFDIRGRLL